MIEIIGHEGSSEYRAALAIKSSLVDLWPDIETTASDDSAIKIAANVKISGYKVSDIDVVVCGYFADPRYFRAVRALVDTNGNRVAGQHVFVQSFAIVVEVKDHDQSGIRITGDKVEVHYSRGGRSSWHSATDQNINQLHAFKAYLDDTGVSAYVHRVVLAPNLGLVSAPGLLNGTFDGKAFLSTVLSTSQLRQRGNRYTLDSCAAADAPRMLNASIFKTVVPTGLDRKRMDRLASKSDAVEKILGSMGNSLLVLHGAGGTGKTVALVQAAYKAYTTKGLRSVLLTYNHALASDIRRTMALMRIPSSVEGGGVTVKTVMSFMYTWFARLQMKEDEDPDYESYTRLLGEAVELIQGGAIDVAEVTSLKEAHPDQLDFDHVFVDEGQDWPPDEAMLLKELYGPTRLTVADGVDQLIRGRPVNWFDGVPRDRRHVLPLRKGLRQKRNLSVFLTALADHVELDLNLDPSEMAGGGRVLILTRPYTQNRDFHDDLVERAKAAGNAEIDMLFCEPGRSRDRSNVAGTGELCQALSDWGYNVWDGTSPKVRLDFPRNVDAFRVVKYESCRGLEGWSVVLNAFDTFLEDKTRESAASSIDGGDTATLVKAGASEEINSWRWAMIALSRPIDTLVIQLGSTSTKAAEALLDVAGQHQDFVEIIP